MAARHKSSLAQMLDRIVEDRVHKDRDRFIESIKEDNICRLASSFHNNEPCAFFKPPTRGSYNICYFVRFCEEEDSWVVRVPLSPCLAFGAHDKLESEVATMQLISEKTTIPIPQIHAYSLSREKGPYGIASFVILEYIDSRTLFDVGLKTLSADQRRHFYDQLADIYIQLRRLEFSSIGVLSRGCNGVEVRKKAVSIDINVQELEGLQPSRIQAKYGDCKGVLSSASDYLSLLLHIAWNAFEKGRKSVYSEEDGKETLYHLHQFFQFAEKKWLNPLLDNGPFVLVHGDLNPYNLMVNENLDIVALLDWEWSRVVPLQFFMPPTWLTNRNTDTLAWPSFYSLYVDELDKFRAAVRVREMKTYGEELLSDEWARVHENGGILVQAALENWTDIDYFAARYLDKVLYKRKDLGGRIKEFMKDNPARGAFVAKKIGDWKAYRAERTRLGIKDPADDATGETQLEQEVGTSSKIGEFLLRLLTGSATIVFLAGTSYIIKKYIIRYPVSR